MPTSTAWRMLPDRNQEILEIVATDATPGSTYVREQLIQMAATIMEAGAQGGSNVEVPLNVEVTRESDTSLKMTLVYVAQAAGGLAGRMADRRREILQAAAA